VIGGTAGGFTPVDAQTYDFSVTPSSSTSFITVGVPANVAQDAAGNKNQAATSLSRTYDTDAPIVSINSPSVFLTRGGPVDFLLNISDADTVNVSTSDVTFTPTGTVNGTVAVLNGTSTPTVRLSGLTGDGTFTISIGGGVATDLAGN